MQKTNKMLEIKAEVPQNGKINKVMIDSPEMKDKNEQF